LTVAPFDCIISNREARTGRAEAEKIEENRNMTKHDAFCNAHAKAYERLPEGTVFNAYMEDVELVSANTPELAAALGVVFDTEDESGVEQHCWNEFFPSTEKVYRSWMRMKRIYS